MKIAIIGSSGFIGKNLSFFLKKNNLSKVFLLSSYTLNKKNWIEKIIREIRKIQPNIIINCAANQNLNNSKKNLIDLINSNLYSNVMFLNEAIRNKKFMGYITFGTKWELGDTKLSKPLNFYAATKQANDSFFKYFSNKKISIISLKIFDTYGPNDKRKKFLNDLLKSYKNNKPLKITQGKQFLDYVHVNDICFLVNKIINDIKSKKLKGYNSFTVSSTKPIRLINLVKKLNKILNKNLKIAVGKKKYRQNQSKNQVNRIFNYPKWKPKHKLFKELKIIFDKG